MARTMVRVEDLRPTQLTLGLAEVRRRASKLEDLSKKELRELLDRKAVPHVVGPGGELFLVDHHHLARALWSLDERELVLGDRLADWSDLPIGAFWHRMEASGYCWPLDADGNRRPYAAIPTHVSALTDNVWRTLAREVRGEAYDDLDTPFQEFRWGDYFRTFMSRRLLDLDYRAAVSLAKRVAALPEAQDLPGYRGSDD